MAFGLEKRSYNALSQEDKNKQRGWWRGLSNVAAAGSAATCLSWLIVSSIA